MVDTQEKFHTFIKLLLRVIQNYCWIVYSSRPFGAKSFSSFVFVRTLQDRVGWIKQVV